MARFRAGRSDCGELAAKAHISDPARESENAAKACGTIDDITCGTIDDIKGKSSQSVTRMLETESRDRVRSLPSLGASLCVMRDSWIGFKCRAGDGLRWAVCQRQRHCARRTVDRPSLTRSKTSGSSPATTGSPIAYSNPMTRSSITAALPGTASSTSRGHHVHRPAQLGTSVLINGTWY